MKPIRNNSVATHLACLLLLSGTLGANAQLTQIKNSTNGTIGALSAGAAWVSGIAPGPGDIGEWNNVATTTGDTITTLGGAYSIGELLFSNNIAGAVSITDTTAADTLTINGPSNGSGVGLDMSIANQNLTLGIPIILGSNITWKISSARTLTWVGVNSDIVFGTNTLTITGGGAVDLNFPNIPNTPTSSSAGAGLVINGATVAVDIQVPSGTSRAYVNFLGSNTSLTMTPSSTTFSTFDLGEVGSSGNHQQTFTNLILNPGTSIFNQTVGRGSSSGCCIGFLAVTRNGGAIADFINNGGNGWGGSANDYGLPEPASGTLSMGWATASANDWAEPRGGQTDITVTPYTADSFTAGVDDNVTLVNDTASSGTVNSLRFNTANAPTLTLSGANTITSGGILMGSTLAKNSVTITGGTLTSGNTNSDGTSDLIIINNTTSSGNMIINSVITDGAQSVGLTVGTTSTTTPTGFIELGGANTFSGTTYVTKGKLLLLNPLALQNSTFNTTLPGTLSFGSLTSATFGGLSGSGSLTLPNNFALSVGGSHNSTLNGAVSGVGATLTKVGSGTLTLNAANTYTGNTSVSNGTLALGASGVFGGQALINSGATLDVSAAGNYTLNAAASGSGTINGNLTLGVGGQLSPTGTTGILTMNNNLTFNGGVALINVDAGNKTNGIITIGAGGSGNLVMTSGSIRLNITDGTLANGTYELIGVPHGTITGVGNVSVSGFNQPNQVATLAAASGQLSLVVSSYTPQNLTWVGDGGGLGLWNVDSDTDWLDGGSASVFNNGDNVTFDNTSTNTTVDLAATFESPGSVTVNGNQNYTFTSSGKISGSGSVTDNNSGTLKVLTTNDYIGGTIINSGTVQVGNGTNGGAIGTGAVQDNGALVWDLPSGTQFMGAASGTGTLTLNGNGTVVLNGADTLAGATTITSGTLKQGVPNALPNGNGVGNIVVNGTLDLGGQNGTVNALTGSGAINSTVVGAPVLTVTGGGTYSGTIGNTAGALALVVNGSGHALELSGAGTYIGGTTVSAGTLQLGISSALGSGDVAVATGAILDLNSFSPTVGALNGGGTIFSTSTNTNGVTLTIGSDNNAGTFSGTIENGSGAGIVNLVMSGTGNETLTGSNTYSGSTTGSGTGTTGAGGLIIINPGGSINCGPLNGSGFVVSGGTLSSSGNSSLGQANNTFLQTSGTTFINAAIPSSTGSDGEFFEITGGTFSAGSLVLGRTANIANATAATPVNAATTTGFYINGAGVNATLGSLSIGTGNSAASARLDAGSLTVSNEVEVGFGNDRWTSFEINGGTFTNLDTVNGLVIAQNASAGEAYFNNGSTSFVQKISFGLATDTAVGTANGGSASTPEGFLYVNSNATLYIGSGGISKLNPHMTANNYGVELISGTLGAIANSVSGVNMNLEGTSNFNFQASDPSGNPWTMTLNGVISGTAAFVADGTGTVVLGGANTYTGGTTISNGIVSFVHGALAGTGGGVTLAGGTLQWQPGNSDDVSALGVTFSLPGGTLDANGNNVTLVNSIGNGGPGTLTVESTAPNGVLNLTGANTYTNNTIVESGTLEANSSSATGTGTVIVESGGTLGGAGTTGNVVVQTGGIISPGNNSVGTLNVGALTLDNGAIGDIEFGSGNDQITATSLKLTNAVFNIFVEGSTQPFSKQGTYTLITYSGPDPVLDSSWTTANTRNPHVGNAALTGIYSFTASGGSLRLNIIQNPALNVATWTAPSSGNWSGQNWSTDPTVPHAVGDTATFGVGTGSGVTTVTLDVNETDGELTFTNVNPFDIAASSPANTLTMNSGGGGASINVLAGVGNTITTPMALGDNMTVSVDSGDSLVLSGSIANSPSVTKTLTINGSGTTVISGANSYGPASGALGTTLSGGGTLQVGNNSALGAGNVSVTSSSTLQAGASVSLSNNISTGSSVTLTLDNNGSTLALGGAISGSGGLTEISAGKLALSGATSYTGPTIVSNGVLSLSGSATMAGTSIIELLSGDLLGNGTLSIAPKIAIGSTSLADTGTYTGLIDAAAGSVFTISGVISDPNSGTDNIEINSESGSTGTVVLGGANTFGPFNNFGTLQGGIVQIYNGLLEVGNTLALQSATLDYSSYGGSLIVASGVSNVTLGAIESTQSPIQNLALTNVSGKGITLTVNGNDNSTTYNGNFTDGGLGGSLTKNGLDTLGLTGTSSFAGTLTVTAGEVDLTGAITCSNVNTSGAGGAEMVVDFGATLIVTNTSTNGSIFATGSAPSLLVNGTAVFNGLIQQNSGNDVGGLIQANSGTLTCSNMLLSRGGADLTTQPTAGDTGDGLYVSGGSVVITNNLDMSSQAANNSTISTRIDSGSLTVGNSITIGLANGGRWSVLDVNGGTLTVTNITNGIFVGATNTGNAELLVRAGTATVGGILVGQGANTGEEAVVNVTGGALYMGSGGIVQAASGVGFVTSLIQLGNGILGATNSWSTAMPVSMTGTGSGGFQTSDMNGVPHNITLTGGANGTGVFGLNLTAVNSPAVGTLTLSGPETWSGGTIINGGTLALVGQDSAAGFLQDTTGVTNASPGVINATGLADGTLHIGDATIKQVAQTLSGNGTNIGNVFIGSKGTLAPGFPIGNISAFNQMPISSKLTVASNGAVVLNIDDQGSGPLNDSVNAASVAFQPDSSLVLNQGNNPLKAGDTFQLFNITGAGLSTATNLHLTLPTLTPDGTLAYAWNTSRLAVNGSITLTGVNPPSTSLSFGVTNGVITMSWPTLGSILQSNSISVTSTNWVNVSGSSNVTTENITINTGQSNVFFRLLQP